MRTTNAQINLHIALSLTTPICVRLQSVVHKCLEGRFLRREIQKYAMERNIRKCTFGHVRMRAVWSESSLGAFWITKNETFLHADNEDYD